MTVQKQRLDLLKLQPPIWCLSKKKNPLVAVGPFHFFHFNQCLTIRVIRVMTWHALLIHVGMIILDTVNHLERFAAKFIYFFPNDCCLLGIFWIFCNCAWILFPFCLLSPVNKILMLILRLLINALKRTMVQRKKILFFMANLLEVDQLWNWRHAYHG